MDLAYFNVSISYSRYGAAAAKQSSQCSKVCRDTIFLNADFDEQLVCSSNFVNFLIGSAEDAPYGVVTAYTGSNKNITSKTHSSHTAEGIMCAYLIFYIILIV